MRRIAGFGLGALVSCAAVAHADPPVFYRVIDLGEPTGGG